MEFIADVADVLTAPIGALVSDTAARVRSIADFLVVEHPVAGVIVVVASSAALLALVGLHRIESRQRRIESGQRR
ncbi:MAG: hypothetical protein HOY78_02120 [Saccharothrix sp.]|nr:hypothetical protein [Saccharothrix sp.]